MRSSACSACELREPRLLIQDPGATMTQTLQIEREGGVARVWLNRPDVRNAFNETVIGEIASTFTGFANDESLRAVVLGGRGKSFCAGADLAWMRAMAD